MTKSERLLELISLLKERQAATVQEMSQACNVSPRTIYRDLSTLLRMNVPIYYADGYRLDLDRDFALADLSADDLELVCYCLHENPLVANPFFKRKFSSLEQRILDRVKGKRNQDTENLFIRETRIDSPNPGHSTDIFERFTQAVRTRHKVAIRYRGVDTSRRLFVPLAIKMSGMGPSLLVTRGEGGTPVEIAERDIAELTVSMERFDRDVAEQSRHVAATNF